MIFLCYSIAADSNVFQYMKYVTTSITHFLALYSEKIKSTEVRVTGLLIQQNETKVELLECEFCNLFCATYKIFDSPKVLNKWWKSIETYNNWRNWSNPRKCDALFEELTAQIIGFMEKEECCISDSSSDMTSSRKDIPRNKQSASLKDKKQPKSEQMRQFIPQTSAETAISDSAEYVVKIVSKKAPSIVQSTQPNDYFVQSDGLQISSFREPQ